MNKYAREYVFKKPYKVYKSEKGNLRSFKVEGKTEIERRKRLKEEDEKENRNRGNEENQMELWKGNERG